MRELKPLSHIEVPPAKKDETYRYRFLDKEFEFEGLKKLLGAADYSKAGDRGAGLAAETEVHREAARFILSNLTLGHLYERPLLTQGGQIDSVMRVNYDIDMEGFKKIETMTVGELKDFLLDESSTEVSRVGKSLTGVMAAAVAKICDVHELIFISQKISRPTRARTTLGLPRTLSSRLQPNHPSDDLRGITALCYLGLSLGSGDALIGVNPAIDSVENVSAILNQLDYLRRQTGAPTQNCVLAHIKTQLQCLRNGVPVEILFQSLAGTEDTNLREFDLTVELLDEGYSEMAWRGPIREAEQFMYFETGQGSEYTYSRHEGVDMCTLEALCYGLARRYDPYMVNNVTGFIGPETHLDNQEMILSNLEDQFMGKLLGLPMGMAPCYTLHAQVNLDGQQMATELLTAAGANYYMDVYLNNDRMLAYFDTSSHDNQTLREIYSKLPTPEFLEWGIERAIFVRKNGKVERGENWGKPEKLASSAAEWREACSVTPALYGFENSGPRPKNKVNRLLRLHQAEARNAVYMELDRERILAVAPFIEIDTRAKNKGMHLNSPSLGGKLSETALEKLKNCAGEVQLVVSDGLSSSAVHANLSDLFPVVWDGLNRKVSLSPPLLVRYGRVKVMEEIAKVTGARVTVLFIGERPGGDADASQSLSAYFAYQLVDPEVQRKAALFSKDPNIQFEYSVTSNIYSKGIPPAEAGSLVVEKVLSILKAKANGNRLG